MLPTLKALSWAERRMADIPVDDNGCRVWPGALNNKGYAKMAVSGTGTFLVHRLAYGIHWGHIPSELDHLCRVRACIEWSHLEGVTHRENMRRGRAANGWDDATCQAGHRWDEVGWWTHKRGRKCKACHRVTARESARRKAARSK